MKNDDLIFRSALKETMFQNEPVERFHPQENKMWQECFGFIENAPAVDAVPVEVLGKWGKLLLPYKGDPRGQVGRMGDGHLEEEALHWGVVTEADGGRWVPVQEAVLLELIEKAKANEPESLRPKGQIVLKERHRGGFQIVTGVDEFWNEHTVRIDTRTVGKEPYCSNCGAALADSFQDYCPRCGAKMDAVDTMICNNRERYLDDGD